MTDNQIEDILKELSSGDEKYILAIDQGTTSTRAIVFDRRGTIVARAQQEFPQIYPKPGWVEHSPQDIMGSTVAVTGEAMVRAGLSAQDISAIGITNQRETTLVWDRKTGKPVYNAIVRARTRRAGRAGFRYGGYLRFMAAVQGQNICNRLHQRKPHYAFQYSYPALGRGAFKAFRYSRKHVAAGLSVKLFIRLYGPSAVWLGNSRLRGGRRPTGCAVRATVHKKGRREEYLWHGLLSFNEYGRQGG